MSSLAMQIAVFFPINFREGIIISLALGIYRLN